MAEKNSLWKNIRNKAKQNRKTGTKPKEPTDEMLRQERKIKAQKADGGETGGMPLGLPLKEQNPFLVPEYNQPMANGYILPDPNRPRLLPDVNASEYKSTQGTDTGDVQIPTIVGGQYIGDNGAWERYKNTGEEFKPMTDPNSYSKFYDTIEPLGLMKDNRTYAEGGYYPTQGPGKALFKGYAAGGKYLTADGIAHRVYRGADGDIMVNHPKNDYGKWDTLNLTDKSNANTIAEGVASVKKWHRENPSYAQGGTIGQGGFDFIDGDGSTKPKKGLQTAEPKPPVYTRENYVKDIQTNLDTYFKDGTFVTPYTPITKPDEKNCINGICYATRKLTNNAINMDYTSNPNFERDINKNNFYRTKLEDGFEIGDVLQYYTRKGSMLSGFPGKVTPVNSNDPWPQHAVWVVGKRTDEKGKNFLKIVNNRGTDLAKIEEISELDLMKRAQEGYNHYDGIVVNRYDPEKVQEFNRIKKENADIFSGKNSYAKEYDNTEYTGAFKPKDIYGKTLGEDASSIEFRKIINQLYPTLGKSSNMPKENFDFLMNHLYGIGHQESNWGYSGKKAIKDAVPESLYPTLRGWSDSNEDDWRQDYWNKNANNVKNQYKNIDEFKKSTLTSNLDPEVNEYLRMHSPKSKGIFQQKELSERGRYFNYGFDDTKSQVASAAALLVDNYHKVKNKFPDKSESELYQLAVLMHNSPSRALNPAYANYYPKQNDVDYFNKVNIKSAQPQEVRQAKPIVKSQTISKSEKEKIIEFLNKSKSTGGNVYASGGPMEYGRGVNPVTLYKKAEYNSNTDKILEYAGSEDNKYYVTPDTPQGVDFQSRLPEFEIIQDTGMYNPNVSGYTAPQYIPSETGLIPNPNYRPLASGALEPVYPEAALLPGSLPIKATSTLGKIGVFGLETAIDNPGFGLGSTIKNTLNKQKNELFKLAKDIKSTADEFIVTPIQFRKEIAELRKLKKDYSSILNTEEGKRRLALLGIDPSKISDYDLTFKPNVGSAFGTGFDDFINKMNIDFRQVQKLKKKGHMVSPKSIFEHEFGHLLQKESYKQQGILKDLDIYNKDLIEHNKIKDRILNNPYLTSIHKSLRLQIHKASEPVKPFITPKPTLTDVGAKQLTINNSIIDNKKIAEKIAAKDKLSFPEKSYSYFNHSTDMERFAHLREMRQNMIESGVIKNMYDPITSEDLAKFIANSPGDRVSSFIDTSPNNIEWLKTLLNNMPAAVPAVGVGVGIGVGALQQDSEPQQQAHGGPINPYMYYAGGPMEYGRGGNFLKHVGAGAYSLGEGILDTVTMGATDQLTDKGFEGLTKLGNKNMDLSDPANAKFLRTQQQIKGYGNTTAAVATGIATGNVQGAVTQGAKGLNTAFQATEGLSDDFKKWSNISNTAIGIGAGLAGGSLNTTGTSASASEAAGKIGEIGGKISPYANQAVGMLGGNSQPMWQQAQAQQDLLNSPEYAAQQALSNQQYVNQGLSFSHGGNIANNSLNLQSMKGRYNNYKNRYAKGGTFNQYGIDMIPDSAGLHHENAYGGVPIGPNALGEGGEIKMDTPDGGQYMVSDQVDGTESQKDFTFSKGGKYKELNRTLAEGMKQDLNRYSFGSLATNSNSKDSLRRPNDSYAQSTIDQIKQKWQQKTEFARQRSQQEQAIAQAQQQKQLIEEEYIAAYGGRINPKKYPGLNMPKKSKGGYVYNAMTEPMLAMGGPLYGNTDSQYTYAMGGPMVSNVQQPFNGPAAQNRGGMMMAIGGTIPGPDNDPLSQYEQFYDNKMEGLMKFNPDSSDLGQDILEENNLPFEYRIREPELTNIKPRTYPSKVTPGIVGSQQPMPGLSNDATFISPYQKYLAENNPKVLDNLNFLQAEDEDGINFEYGTISNPYRKKSPASNSTTPWYDEPGYSKAARYLPLAASAAGIATGLKNKKRSLTPERMTPQTVDLERSRITAMEEGRRALDAGLQGNIGSNMGQVAANTRDMILNYNKNMGAQIAKIYESEDNTNAQLAQQAGLANQQAGNQFKINNEEMFQNAQTMALRAAQEGAMLAQSGAEQERKQYLQEWIAKNRLNTRSYKTNIDGKDVYVSPDGKIYDEQGNPVT
jgi:hypothetical protein